MALTERDEFSSYLQQHGGNIKQLSRRTGKTDSGQASKFAGLAMVAQGLGTFIDTNATVDYTVPKPVTLAMFGAAVIAVGAERQRRAKTYPKERCKRS